MRTLRLYSCRLRSSIFSTFCGGACREKPWHLPLGRKPTRFDERRHRGSGQPGSAYCANLAVTAVLLTTIRPRIVTLSSRSLGAAQEPDVKRALDNDKIEAFIITAYDGVSFGDCMTHRYLNPSLHTEQITAAMIREYSDFTLYLYQR
jgi:hypothetical protein